jgi:hypothetical protein
MVTEPKLPFLVSDASGHGPLTALHVNARGGCVHYA